jgi:hypothetical protein
VHFGKEEAQPLEERQNSAKDAQNDIDRHLDTI